MTTPDTDRIRRVLITADTVGGVWTYALELARGLARSGVEVTLATMGPLPGASQLSEVRSLPNVRLHHGAFKLEWMADPWEDVEAAGDWLLELAERVDADLVHLNGYVHASLPWRIPALVAGHSCVFSWWAAVRREQPPPEWARYRREVARGLAAADLVVCPSASMLNSLRACYGLALDGAMAIPNGRSGPFAPGPKLPMVFCAGRLWDEAKNVRALAEAAGRLRWPVFVAGEDCDPDGRRRAFPNVRALGRLSEREIAAWYSRAAIYALPARYEPFGLTALEAAVSGCALVLGDIDSLRENWDGAAVFVPPDDAGALEDAVARLSSDPKRLGRLQREARARAASFTPERMAAAYANAYRQLAREKSCVS